MLSLIRSLSIQVRVRTKEDKFINWVREYKKGQWKIEFKKSEHFGVANR